jgi:DNA replication protein DnaD
MRKFFFAIFLFTLSVQAFSETCKSGPYTFEISKETITLKATDSMTLNIVLRKTLMPGRELQELVTIMVNETDTGKPLTNSEAATITKISLKATEGTPDADVFTYAEAFNKTGNLVARYVMFVYGNFRCR